jgi:hypothetical protein
MCKRRVGSRDSQSRDQNYLNYTKPLSGQPMQNVTCVPESLVVNMHENIPLQSLHAPISAVRAAPHPTRS